jgi:hypothetical protein
VLTSAQQYSVSSVPATPTLHESVGSLAFGGVLPVHEYPDAVLVHPVTVESAMHVADAAPQLGAHESTSGEGNTAHPMTSIAAMIEPARTRIDIWRDDAEKSPLHRPAVRHGARKTTAVDVFHSRARHAPRCARRGGRPAVAVSSRVRSSRPKSTCSGHPAIIFEATHRTAGRCTGHEAIPTCLDADARRARRL